MIYFDSPKAIEVFNKILPLNEEYIDLYDLAGGFAVNFPIGFPDPFTFVSLNFHISVDYVIDIDMKTALVSDT